MENSKNNFFERDRLVRYHRLKKGQAMFGRMLLKISLDKMREQTKEGKKIPDTFTVGPILKLEQEYGIGHKAINKIMLKLGRKICTDTEYGHRAKAIIIKKEEVESINDLFDYWKKYLKLPKTHRQVLYYVILYLLRLSA